MHDPRRLLLHFMLVFLGRHWLVAFVNAGMTALLGAGLLALARRGKLFSAPRALGLFHLVLLVAVLKGAFYLVLGDSMGSPAKASLVLALQFPDPIELLGFTPQSGFSIWHPTTDTAWVSVLLLGWALLFFVKRVQEMRRSQRALQVLVLLTSKVPAEGVVEALRRAGTAMSLSAHVLPPVILAEVSYPTPLLLGVTRPCLLLSPRVAAALTEDELELAFRHELAHFRRRDHWKRWMLTWALDVGRLNLVSHWLGKLALDAEEALCDHMAVRSAQDAVALGTAITKAASLGTFQSSRENIQKPPGSVAQAPGKGAQPYASDGAASFQVPPPQEIHPAAVPPGEVVPALQGRYLRQRQRPDAIRRRLEELAGLVQELADSKALLVHQRLHPLLARATRAIFMLLLFLILYSKIHLTIGPR